jgi:hypothetical protein
LLLPRSAALSVSLISRSGEVRAQAELARNPSLAAVLRTALVVACIAALAFALWSGDSAAHAAYDPDLARVLRFMAIVKAGIALSAMALLLWRFGRPVSIWGACACIAGTCLLVGASVLIWQLTSIPAAAGAFHVGLLVVLVAAWRERKG